MTPRTDEYGNVVWENTPSESFNRDMINAIANMEARLAKPRWNTSDMDPVALRKELIDPIESAYASTGAMKPGQLAAYKLRLEQEAEQAKLAEDAKQAAMEITLKRETEEAKRIASEKGLVERANTAKAHDESAMARTRESLNSKSEWGGATFDTNAKVWIQQNRKTGEVRSAKDVPEMVEKWQPFSQSPQSIAGGIRLGNLTIGNPSGIPPFQSSSFSPVPPPPSQSGPSPMSLPASRLWKIRMKMPSGEMVEQYGDAAATRTPSLGPTATIDLDSERAEAVGAIRRGANEAKVRARFKQRTGQEL